MRALILGGQGMLGHKLFQVLSRHIDTYATVREYQGYWQTLPVYAASGPDQIIPNVNAADFILVKQAVSLVKPDVIINCIGIIKQLKEADDPIISITINSLFPHQLARLCAETGIRLIHLSTDCVFSGQKGNYTETDIPDPIDLYGRTKLLGEVNRPGCLTIRTSIIGRDFVKQTGLVEWFLSNRGRTVKGYINAIYSGLTTQALSEIIATIITQNPDLSGLYHIAGPPISKVDLLGKIQKAMNLDITIEPYDNPLCDRSLNGARFTTLTGCPIPDWDEMITGLALDSTPYDEWRKIYAIH